MLNKSLKKLIAVASTFTMLVSAFAPMASAVTLSSPVKVGEANFATAKSIDGQDAAADGTIVSTTGKIESTVTADTSWTVGKYLTFDATINAATADNGGTILYRMQLTLQKVQHQLFGTVQVAVRQLLTVLWKSVRNIHMICTMLHQTALH